MTKEKVDTTNITKKDIIETTLGDLKSFVDGLVSKYGTEAFVELCDASSGDFMTIFSANFEDWEKYHYNDETGEESYEDVMLLTLYLKDTL